MRRRPKVKPIPELNMQKVLAALRKTHVGLSSEDGINLVTNTYFMLVLNDDELWHIQASLRLRELGKMYYPGNPQPYRDFPENARKIIAEAINAISVPLEVTGLSDLNDFTYLARDGGYVMVSKKYLDIFNNIKTAEQAADNRNGVVLINGRHLICPVRAEASKYLVLPQRARLEAV